MAVSKIIKDTSFSIEIQKGEDAAGDPTYNKKTFSDVKNDAEAQNIYDVAEAIKDVLEAGTGATFVNVASTLVNA